MKNAQMIVIGLLNGIYFLNFGLEKHMMVTVGAGLVVITLSVLIVWDGITASRSMSKIIKTVATPLGKPFVATSIFLNTQKNRWAALFKIYQNAPLILENHRRVEEVGQKLMLMESRSELWKLLEQSQMQMIGGFENSASPYSPAHSYTTSGATATPEHISPVHPSNVPSEIELNGDEQFQEARIAAVKTIQKFKTSVSNKNKKNSPKREFKSIPSKILVFEHTVGSHGDIITAIENHDVFKDQPKANALMITDIGETDLTTNQLDHFMDGEIDLDFWIAKKSIHSRDLLVIPSVVFESQTDLVWSAVDKISKNYTQCYLLVSPSAAKKIAEARTPISQRVLKLAPLIVDLS